MAAVLWWGWRGSHAPAVTLRAANGATQQRPWWPLGEPPSVFFIFHDWHIFKSRASNIRLVLSRLEAQSNFYISVIWEAFSVSISNLSYSTGDRVIMEMMSTSSWLVSIDSWSQPSLSLWSCASRHFQPQEKAPGGAFFVSPWLWNFNPSRKKSIFQRVIIETLSSLSCVPAVTGDQASTNAAVMTAKYPGAARCHFRSDNCQLLHTFA